MQSLALHLSAWSYKSSSKSPSSLYNYGKRLTFDAAVSPQGSWIGVSRTDPRGSLLHAWSAYNSTTTPEEGEAHALLEAILCAKNMDSKQLHLATDAKDLIEELLRHDSPQAATTLESLDQTHSLLNNYSCWSVKYIGRANHFLTNNIAQCTKSHHSVGAITIPSLPPTLLQRK